ncbi:MAG: hypothetical protein ABI051_13875 [Vicinamibacterales bacterium]
MSSCLDLRHELGPFVDGELRGAEMLMVSQHLSLCDECTREIRLIVETGESLRACERQVGAIDLQGLASNVLSRRRAESEMSWRALAGRVFEDWHYTIVGAGSLAATFVSTLLVSLLLAFGPAPERQDSLAALISNLGASTGSFYVLGTPAGEKNDAVVLQVANGWPATATADAGMIFPVDYRAQTEAELVRELVEAVTHNGRVLTLDGMRLADRLKVEALLDDITRLRALPPVSLALTRQTMDVHELRLVTSIGVSARSLAWP